MTAPFKTWTVLPHGELIQVADNILTVVGEISMLVGQLQRRMTIVRLKDRRLIIYSAIALEERAMAQIEEFGVPSFLVVPSDIHRLDARIWKDRYPSIKVIAPGAARAKVEEIVPVDATTEDFGESDVRLVAVPGTDDRELALEITGLDGSTLVMNDLIGNIHDAKGVAGWFLRFMNFAGDEPHIPKPVKWKLIQDKSALQHQLLS